MTFTIGIIVAFLVGLTVGLLVPKPLIHGARTEIAGGSDRGHIRHSRFVWLLVGVFVAQALAIAAGVAAGSAISKTNDNVADLQQQGRRLHATISRLKTDETNQRDRAACQARVNANLIAILHSRANASRQAILAPRAFFQVLFPALTAPQLTPEQMAALSPAQRRAREAHIHQVLEQLIVANHAANEAYQHYVDSQESHPLPPIPTCS